jgi:hypothetical protein
MTQAQKFHFSTSMFCCRKVVCSANSSTIAKFSVLLYFNVLLHNNNQHLMSCCIILGHFRKLHCCTNELCSAEPILKAAAIAPSNDPFFCTSLLHNPSTLDHNYYCHSQNNWAPALCTKSCQPKRLAIAHSWSTYNMKERMNHSRL